MSMSVWKYVAAAACIGGAIVAFVAAACSAMGCASGPTPTAADLTAYTAEQMSCVRSLDSRTDVDVCRAESRGRWCVKFPASVNCKDGGP